MSKEKTWVDEFIGRRIREERKKRGISQEKLGKEIGVTFQQVQKYENGTNRITASRLHEVCRMFQLGIRNFVPEWWEPEGGAVDKSVRGPKTTKTKERIAA